MSMRFRALLSVCLCGLLTSTAAAQAPSAISDSLRNADSSAANVAVSGPSLANESAAFRAPARAVTVGVQNGAGVDRARFGRGETLMIVGGATVVVGAIIGEEPGQLFMVGGAVIFLYGLYEYLKTN